MKFQCKADRSGVGGNDPQDCDWPHCHCDGGYSQKVIEALVEEGWWSPDDHAADVDDVYRYCERHP